MAIGFRKSFKVLPGVRVTLSKRGASASAGPKGAKVGASTTGKRRVSLGWKGFFWRRQR